jgi:hypothetical protein
MSRGKVDPGVNRLLGLGMWRCKGMCTGHWALALALASAITCPLYLAGSSGVSARRMIDDDLAVLLDSTRVGTSLTD